MALTYKGVTIKEIKSSNFNDLPKEMLVWGNLNPNDEQIYKRVVDTIATDNNGKTYAIARQLNGSGVAIWDHFAEIPPSRLATKREVARWLAKGFGEVRISEDDIHSFYNYSEGDENDEFIKFKVRKWEDTEWHEATIEYLGIK